MSTRRASSSLPAEPRLRLGDGFSLPLEAVTQTFGVLAVRGAGKTYLTAVLVEEMVSAGLPVVVVDPVGVWWGLRSSADGTSPGLPVVILGGDHGDVPLESTAGELVAAFVVETRQPVVLDLSRFRKGELIRFMTDFAETLYRAKSSDRGPLHLVIDEADAVAPQRTQKGVFAERLLGAVEDLVRRGRARGLGVTLVTQRAAVLNKNVLTQIETLIALRTIAPQDRDAIDDWIKVHGTPEQRETMMASLASLPRGTAWIWSPGWLDVFRRVEIRKRKTFDSSATPTQGTGQGASSPLPAPALAPVDLEQLRARMAETVARLEADDPKALKKRIAALERELAEARKALAEKPPAAPLLDPQHVAALERMGELFRQPWVGDLVRALAAVGQAVPAAPPAKEPRPTPVFHRREEPRPAAKRIHTPAGMTEPAAPAPRVAMPATPSADGPLAGFKGGARRIVMRLAQFHRRGGLSRRQLATLTAFSPAGGAFGEYVSQLKRAGLIVERNDRFDVTPAGLEAAADVAPIDHAELRGLWSACFKQGARRMLGAVLDEPAKFTRETLAEHVGFEPTGGAFGEYLSLLRRHELVVEEQDKRLRPGPAFDVLEGRG